MNPSRRAFVVGLGVTVFARPVRSNSIVCSDLKIGVILPLTGPFARVGAEMLNGVEQAVGESDCSASIISYDATQVPKQIAAAEHAVVADTVGVIMPK